MDQKTKDYYRCMAKLKVGDVVVIGLSSHNYPTTKTNPQAIIEVVVVGNRDQAYYKRLVSGTASSTPLLLGSSGPIPGFWPKDPEFIMNGEINYCFWADPQDVRIIKRKT
jgi:hypothetical protein